MLFKSPVISQGSGTIAGITYAHNRSGNYQRNWRKPVDPRTVLQQDQRANFAMLSTDFVNNMDPGVVEQWNAFAASNPVLNPLGEQIFLTGRNWWQGGNMLRMQAGLDPYAGAPDVMTLALLNPPSSELDVSTLDITVTFNTGDLWVGTDDAALLVFCSATQSASRHFYKGPWRFAGAVLGDGTTPPTSPATFTFPWGNSPPANFPVFFQYVVVMNDARRSPWANSMAPSVP
jgi:hypothetical protein